MNQKRLPNQEMQVLHQAKRVRFRRARSMRESQAACHDRSTGNVKPAGNQRRWHRRLRREGAPIKPQVFEGVAGPVLGSNSATGHPGRNEKIASSFGLGPCGWPGLATEDYNLGIGTGFPKRVGALEPGSVSRPKHASGREPHPKHEDARGVRDRGSRPHPLPHNIRQSGRKTRAEGARDDGTG